MVDDDEKMDFSEPLVFDDDDITDKESTPIALVSKSSADSGFVSSTDVSPLSSFDHGRMSAVPVKMTPSLPIPIRAATTNNTRAPTPATGFNAGKSSRSRYGTGFTEDELLFAMYRLGW
jgi:hypothetical protein